MSRRKHTSHSLPPLTKKSHRWLHIVGAILLLLVVAGVSCGLARHWVLARRTRTNSQHQAASVDEPLKPANSDTTPNTPSNDSTTPATTHDISIPPIKDGLAPVISRLDTKEPVVFLGIDDGAHKDPAELQMMQDNHVHATLFLANEFIHDNPGFFKDFVPEGSQIEDHTLDHKLLTNLSYDDQKAQICGMADLEQKEYGRRPILMRPPGGAYNTDTQRAAAACGMKAVVQWIAKANGGSMQYQIGNKLRPGDIVLMHFRPEFKSDMQAFLNAQNAAGLHTELLEDWLPAQ